MKNSPPSTHEETQRYENDLNIGFSHVTLSIYICCQLSSIPNAIRGSRIDVENSLEESRNPATGK